MGSCHDSRAAFGVRYRRPRRFSVRWQAPRPAGWSWPLLTWTLASPPGAGFPSHQFGNPLVVLCGPMRHIGVLTSVFVSSLTAGSPFAPDVVNRFCVRIESVLSRFGIDQGHLSSERVAGTP